VPTNPVFNKMESDLYNLFPEIGELNGLRSNYSMANNIATRRNFGECKVKLSGRKFEPQDSAKGIVARTYFNMDQRYPGRGIVSEKNRKTFEEWDKLFSVTQLECNRWKRFEMKNGYTHYFWPRCLLLFSSKPISQ
jgi:deoxyribonuclease I